MHGLITRETSVTSLTNADDTVLTAESHHNLQNLVTQINSRGKECELLKNITTTKAKVISREEKEPTENRNTNGKTLERETKFVYLAHIITDYGK